MRKKLKNSRFTIPAKYRNFYLNVQLLEFEEVSRSQVSSLSSMYMSWGGPKEGIGAFKVENKEGALPLRIRSETCIFVLQIYSNIFAFTERFFLINLVVGILQNEKSRSGDVKVVNTNSTYAPPLDPLQVLNS